MRFEFHGNYGFMQRRDKLYMMRIVHKTCKFLYST